MKSKKRRHVSSDESEDSNASDKSSSSSESDTVESTHSEHRSKKKKKRAESSDSDSESDDQRHTKKRKHKKKKKKHVKKKKRSHSEGESESAEEEHFLSEGEISVKKKRKHKHKHSKRERSLSLSEVESDNARGSRRLHSVVKERRGSSEEVVQPVHPYYQKDYHRSQLVEDYEREREVQRFYRGSSKEHRQQYPEHYQHYERERNDRCLQDAKNLEIYDQNMHYNQSYDDHSSSQRDNDYKRQRYDDRRPQQEEYQGRGRRDDAYNSRPDLKGYNRYNQYEERPKRREYEDNREQWDRRPAEQERYREREREYPDKKEEPPRRYREEGFSDRPREPRRDRPTPRVEKVQPIPHRDYSRSRSPDVHYKERNIRRGFDQAERDERSRDGRQEVRIRNGRPQERDRNTRPSERDRAMRQNERVIEERIERSDRPRRSQERRPQRERPREDNFKNESRTRDKKSRFADVDEKKEFEWGKADLKKEGDKPQGDKEKPNFGLSGKLTADVNTVNGVVIKYSEPDDAKQPKRRWRFYPFKGDKALPILYIHRQSAFLIGRDKKVVDIALEHPSVSKQHAALQYRATPFTRPDGSQGRRVRPYIIDLESANGTFVNNKKIEPRRYVELLERDVVKFGFSQREYVLLHENSKDDAQDDDNVDPNEMGAAVTTTDQIKHEKRLKQEVAEDG